jgi:filamentous hemagglutinin family protein
MSDRVRSHKLGLPLLAALLTAGPVHAQIVTDGSVGPKVSLRGGEIEIGADLGTRRGDNLFHSFETFGIATGQTATFTGPGAIKNVISRVTGGEVSRIDGTLSSKVGQADLYFLNPAGVIFGPNAQLDVPGSLHVSTAHELRFADGTRFSAVDSAGSGLTVAPPEAFGFLDRTTGPVRVEQSRLQMTSGKTLSLIGGDVEVVGTNIKAESSTVNLAAVTGPGQVTVADSALEAVSQGTVRLDRVTLDTSGTGGGTVRIRGGTLVADQSTVLADNTGERDAAGGIDVQVVGTADLNASSLTTNAFDAGRGGALKVKAGELSIRNGVLLASNTYGPGHAGTVTVTGRDIEVRNGGEIGSNTFARGNGGAVKVQAEYLLVSDFSNISSNAELFSTGSAGDVQVTAKNLQVLKGSNIQSSTSSFKGGKAGTVDVQADHLLVSGDGSVSTISSTTGRYSKLSTGSAGDVHITAKDLQVRNGGIVSTSTFAQGDAGTVDVQADHLLISGDGSALATNISSTAEQNSTGSAGNVQVKANDLQVLKGGEISTSTFSSGHAGAVNVQADHLLVSAVGSEYVTAISSTSQPYPADQPHSGPLPTGNAGTVTVTGRNIEVRDGGKISSDTLTQGNAGQITVKADHVLVEGTDPAGHSSTIGSSAATSSTAPHSGPLPTGNAGTVAVTATHELELHDGGLISSDTLTQGNAGQITVKADQVLVEGTDPAGVPSAITSIAVGSNGAGGAVTIQAQNILLQNHGAVSTQSVRTGPGEPISGAVTIQAQNILLQNHGAVSTESYGTGLGGPISISATNTLRLDTGEIGAQSTMAGGGNIALAVGRLFDLRQSAVTTSVAGGAGSGGNITIDHPSFMILDGSRIEANAFGGPGGNITIQADQLIRTPDSVIEASSELGLSGAITIAAPNTDVAGSLIVLPETLFDVSSQLREACAARGGRPGSSFTAGGRGGLPPDPGAPLAASSFGQPSGQQTATGSSTPSSRLQQAVKPIPVAGIPQPVLGSPRLTCRG